MKVALSGEGGDELFGGYYTYVVDLLRSARVGLGGAGTSARRAAAELIGEGEPRLQGEALRPRGATTAARAPSRVEGDLLAEARAALHGPAGRGIDPVDVYRARFAETAGAEELARLQDVDLAFTLSTTCS